MNPYVILGAIAALIASFGLGMATQSKFDLLAQLENVAEVNHNNIELTKEGNKGVASSDAEIERLRQLEAATPPENHDAKTDCPMRASAIKRLQQLRP